MLRRRIFTSRNWIVISLSILINLFSSPNLAYANLEPDPANFSVFQSFIQHLIGLIVPVGFVALLFMLTWAGIKFLTSGGEQAALKQAREIATWAVLGIIFLALAWIILLLVKAFTGVDVTQFNLQLCNPMNRSCSQ